MGDPRVALRVALVEDDEILRERVLLPSLIDYGFDVEGFDSASSLYRRMLASHFDIVVLDIGLPGESGLSAARHLRSVSDSLIIVMLTGNRGRQDHVRALYDGADAYLSKPVDDEVLAVTLRSLARRIEIHGSEPVLTSSNASPVQQQGWRLANDGWCLSSPSGGVLALTSPERNLMMRLEASRGEPVEREVLIAALSEDALEFDTHRLEMVVHRLRRKAAAISDELHPLPLLAARGVGYLLAV